ncbi:DUF7379 domain-containing protein [Actinomycetospora sp. CA-053990]|uniref:esterase/lipase family protein n=1 Tax=Actinomycetospora sp. CA-053990 TaxID=3239891 RepID=UPI003D8F1B70
MTVPLNGGDEPVTIGERVRLRAPGMTGTVEVRSTVDSLSALEAVEVEDTAGSAGGDGGACYLEWALANASLTPQTSFAIAPTSAPKVDSRVEVTASAPDRQAVLLSRDAAGMLRWHLPETTPAPAPITEAARPPDLSFLIPPERFAPPPLAATRTADAEPDRSATSADPATRSESAAEAATVLTLLEFPVGSLGGQLAAGAYAQWEQIARPSLATWFRPKHGLQQGVALTDANWRTLAEGRTLLFLHGIFSTSASAFGGLFDTSRRDNAELWAHLERAYDRRIIAFDHPTASVPPEQNAKELLGLIPDDVHLELDIVCHSRGGLVARILDGQLPLPASGNLLDVLMSPARWLLGGNRSHATVTVRKIVFVGTPNSGTNIVEEENWSTFIDSFTTLLDVMPPGPWNATTPVFEGVLELVKALAAGTADNLPGLRAMDPDSGLYAGLDHFAGNAPLYYAIEANYEPEPRGRSPVRDAVDDLIDPIFHQQPNDIAVPTAGVGDPATARPVSHRPTSITGFPVPADRRLVFDPGEVWHLSYFQQPETRACLQRWLT